MCISIHALCEEGDEKNGVPNYATYISIHALCEEGDYASVADMSIPFISIHALCEEGDLPPTICPIVLFAFLSTPSARRATSSRSSSYVPQSDFYPRPLRGGRPSGRYEFRHSRNISIHALCEEGDSTLAHGSPYIQHFYPRPLRGGRHVAVKNTAQIVDISIHALCEEGDGCSDG